MQPSRKLSKLSLSEKSRRKNRGKERLAKAIHAIEYLEPRTLFSSIVWSSGAGLPAGVADAAAVDTYSGVLLLGGTGANGSTSKVEELGAFTNSWVQLPALDQARTGLGVGATGLSGPARTDGDGPKYVSDIFAVGGASQSAVTGSILSYDPNNSNNNTAGPSMSTAREFFGYAVDPTTGGLYAIGGISASGQTLSSAEVYDETSDSWSAIAPLPVALSHMSAADDGVGHIYVFGGDDATGTPVSTVYQYTIATDSWALVSTMPNALSDTAAVYSSYGTIYVIGGKSASGAVSSVENYDPVLNSWSDETSLPTALYGAAAVIDTSTGVATLDVIGGFNSANVPQATMFSSAAPAPLVGLPAIPTIQIYNNWTYYTGAPQAVQPYAVGADGYTPVDGTYSVTYDGSTAPPTNVGDYSVVVNFTSNDPNYVNTTVVGDLYIAPASPTITLTGGGTINWDGNPHPVSATEVGVDGVTPVAGTFSYTYNGLTAAPVNPGTYAVVATFSSSDPNYANATANATITIPDPTIPTGLKAVGSSPTSITISWNPVAVPVSGYNVYEQIRHVTHSPRGSGGTVTITYTLVGSTTGATSVTIGGLAQAYAGSGGHVYYVTSVSPTGVESPRVASVTGSPAYAPSLWGTLDGGALVSWSNVEVGQTKQVTIVAYGSPYPTFSLIGAPATMSVDPITGIVTYTPGPGEVGVTNVTFQATNSTGTATETFQFHVLAQPTVVITGGTYSFDGNTHSASAVAYGTDGVTPIAGTISLVYAPVQYPSSYSTSPYAESGTYNVLATFTSSDPNYGGASASLASGIVINPIAPTITVTNQHLDFDGAAHPAVASATGAGGASVYGNFAFTYNGSTDTPSAPGTYAVSVVFTSGSSDYTNATGAGTLIINAVQATPIILFADGPYTYDGTPKTDYAFAVTPDGTSVAGTIAVTYDGQSTPPTDAGTYSVQAVFTSGDSSFADTTAYDTLVIGQAAPVLPVLGGPFVYDGTAHNSSAVATGVDGVTPVAGNVSLTYNGSTTAPTDAGSYDVIATFTSADPNYTDSAGEGILTINQATPVFSALSAPTITAGISSTIISGKVTAGPVVPAGETVSITLNHVTQSAVVDGTGAFSTSFATASLGNGSYTITYAYAGDGADFAAAANATSKLTVVAQTVAPAITRSPSSQTVMVGQSVSLTATASGTPTPTIQWQVSTNGGQTFMNVAGATHTTATFNATASENGYQYRAVFTNSAGTATTSPATLTVRTPLRVTTNPTNQNGTGGRTVSFTAAAVGTPMPTVQWQVSTNGGTTFTNIVGATSAMLKFVANSGENGYLYRAMFTNSQGSVVTTAALLTA